MSAPVATSRPRAPRAANPAPVSRATCRVCLRAVDIGGLCLDCEGHARVIDAKVAAAGSLDLAELLADLKASGEGHDIRAVVLALVELYRLGTVAVTVCLPDGPNQHIRRIQRVTAAHFGIPVDALRGQHRGIVLARHVAMHLCQAHLGCTAAEIARAFHRDHSSVSSALRNMGERRTDPRVHQHLAAIEQELKREARAGLSAEDRTLPLPFAPEARP